MKNIIIAITGVCFCLLACKESTNDVVEMQLACTVNTFDAPIHAISKATGKPDRLYIGLENGNIIRMQADKRQVFSCGGKRTVYDILEHNSDSLFVGTRDGGLRLIILQNDTYVRSEAFSIAGKDLKYSVYSIAKDSMNRILYLGTSNGLYQMNLNDSSGLIMLQRIEIEAKRGKEYYGIHKVIFRGNTLFIAGDPGLFIGKSQSHFLNPVKDTRVNNIVLDCDTIYALLENAVVRVDNPCDATDSVYKTIASGKFYSYSKIPGNEEWLLSGRAVFLRKDGMTYEHRLPDGITPSGKQVGLMDNDFYYVAYRESLLAFPLRQNTQGRANSVVAVSDRNSKDGMVYFITSDLKLHRYCFDDSSKDKSKSEFMGQIRGINIHEEIVKFIHAGDKAFFLATRKNLYKIKGNIAECIADLNKMEENKDNDFNALYFSPDENKLYTGTRQYLGSINCPPKSSNQSGCAINVITDMDTTDLYVVDICGRGDDVYVATLNKGLFERKGEQGKFEKIWAAEKYGSTYGLAINGREDLLLNTSEGIIYNDSIRTLNFLDIENIKAIYRVYEDNSSDGIFVINYHGIYYQSLGHSLIEKRSRPLSLFNDIAFSKPRIAVKGEMCVLGSRLGLFLYNQSTLTPITIQEEKNYTVLYISITTILLLIGGTVVWCLYIKNKEQQRRISKLSAYIDDVNVLKAQVHRQVKKEDREDLIVEFEGLTDRLARQKQSKYISATSVREMKNEINTLRTVLFAKSLTLNEYIDKNLKEADQRIEVIRNVPKAGMEEYESLLKEIIKYQKKIKSDPEYHTVKYVDTLKERLLNLEKKLMDNIAAYRHLFDETTMDKIEGKINSIKEKIDKNYKTGYIKKECDEFVDAHPQLRKLPFMQKKGNDARYYTAVLFFIQDINAKTICDVLGLDNQQSVNKFKYTARERIEDLYEKDPAMKDDKIIGLLYRRLKKSEIN